MAASVLVDSGFLVALLNASDRHHGWAVGVAATYPRPWATCESVLSETFFLMQKARRTAVATLVSRGAVTAPFSFNAEQDAVVALMRKYADVPMSLADACVVRMTEIMADPLVITTDGDFRVYRRQGRQSVPCVLPDLIPD